MDMLNEALKKAVQQLPKEILNKVIVNSKGEVINLAPLDTMTLEPTHLSHNISSINDKFKDEADKPDNIIKIDLTVDEIEEEANNKLNVMSYSKSTARVPIRNPTVIFPAAVQLQVSFPVTDELL